MSQLALAAGVIGACTVMLLRVTVACAVLNPALARTLPRLLAVAFVVGGLAVLAGWRSNTPETGNGTLSDSPLQLRAALQMTALLQLVLFVILAVQARWSSEALVATAALVGLTDLDALTLSLARSTVDAGAVPTAAFALVTGILSNTVLKLMVAVVVGRGGFRAATACGLGATALALSGALWVAR